ncbi:MAG: hypothetical protein U1A22_13725 [Xanthomonadaceae bacterium]|nr:hypothetical protein [Xanthomonadaceae bacterium]
MNRTAPILIALIALIAVLAQSPAASAQTTEQEWKQQVRQVQRDAVRALLDSDNPRELLLAALLYPVTVPEGEQASEGEDGSGETSSFDPNAEPVRLLARAAELAPDDPLIAWAQAGCPQAQVEAGCDQLAGRQRLLRLDPANGYVKLLWLETILAQGQDLVAGAMLTEAARSNRFETYDNQVGRLFLDFFGGLSWPKTSGPAMTGEAVALGYTVALSSPGYAPLMTLCLPGGTPVDDRALRTDCMAVFSRMFGGESVSMSDASTAVSALLKLTDGLPEHHRWQAEQRRLKWLQQRALPIMSSPDFLTGAGPAHIRLWFQRGELNAMRELLRENGVAVEPPANWPG